MMQDDFINLSFSKTLTVVAKRRRRPGRKRSSMAESEQSILSSLTKVIEFQQEKIQKLKDYEKALQQAYFKLWDKSQKRGHTIYYLNQRIHQLKCRYGKSTKRRRRNKKNAVKVDFQKNNIPKITAAQIEKPYLLLANETATIFHPSSSIFTQMTDPMEKRLFTAFHPASAIMASKIDSKVDGFHPASAILTSSTKCDKNLNSHPASSIFATSPNHLPAEKCFHSASAILTTPQAVNCSKFHPATVIYCTAKTNDAEATFVKIDKTSNQTNQHAEIIAESLKNPDYDSSSDDSDSSSGSKCSCKTCISSDYCVCSDIHSPASSFSALDDIDSVLTVENLNIDE